MEPLRTMLRPPLPLDLGLTLGILGFGKPHPCIRRDRDGSWWRATRTPLGPATTRFVSADGAIRAEAWGPGKEWALDAAPELLGSRDPVDAFDPAPGIVRDLHRRMPGLRIPRSRAVFETLAPTILEQKVPGAEAFTTYRNLVRAFGEPAPGPAGLRRHPRRTPWPGPPIRRSIRWGSNDGAQTRCVPRRLVPSGWKGPS